MSLILSGTDGLSDVDGSASTPAIRGTDTNTGIFFPAADTIAFAEGGVESARFDSSGNFSQGTTNAATDRTRLIQSTNSGTTNWYTGPWASVSTNYYITSSAATTGVYLNGTSATSWSALSDERFKTDLEPIENAAQKVCSLRAVTGILTLDETRKRKAFLIAQDVLAVLPEAVDTTNPNQFGLAYTDTIPLLVAAIQEQQALIQSLTARIAALEAKE